MENKHHLQEYTHLRTVEAWVGIGGIVLVYVVLACLDAQWYFPQLASSQLALAGLQYASSLVVAMLFLGVGVLVWMYAQPREIALLLSGMCALLMICFLEETAALLQNQFALLLSRASSLGAIWILAAFLLRFPTPIGPGTVLFKRVFTGTCIVLLCICFAFPFLYVLLTTLGGIRHTASISLYALGFIVIGVACLRACRCCTTRRTRRQLSLLIVGLIIGIGPFLLVTFLPTQLQISPQVSVESQWSTLTMAFLPLLVGYAALEYQLLVEITVIQRFLKYITSAVGIFILMYYTFVEALLHNITNDRASIYFALTLAFLYPCTWQGLLFLTNKLFSQGTDDANRLLDRFDAQGHALFSLDTVLQPYLSTVKSLLETDTIVVLLFDAETGYYVPVFSPQGGHPTSQQGTLLQTVEMAFAPPSVPEQSVTTPFIGIAAFHPLAISLFDATRPLYLSELQTEAQKREEKKGGHWRRNIFLGPLHLLGTFDPLVVPITGNTLTRNIGILIVGERRDQSVYSAPDFATLSRIHQRWGNHLESCYQDMHVQRRTMVLSNMYAVRAGEVHTREEEHAFLLAFAKIAAVHLDVGVDVWWCADEEGNTLQRVQHVGEGQEVHPSTLPTPLEKDDWIPRFYEGTLSREGASREVLPPCLRHDTEPPFSLAWLPLTTSGRGEEKKFGILAFTYARPHRFTDEDEKRFLQVFVQQCVAGIEYSREMEQVGDLTAQQKERLHLFTHRYQKHEDERAAMLTTLLCSLHLLQEYGTTLPLSSLQALVALTHDSRQRYERLMHAHSQNSSQSKDGQMLL